MRLIPRETKFFDMFAEVADNLIKGAKVCRIACITMTMSSCRPWWRRSRKSSTTATT